jgi:catechol 2,3-dioxygenase-like lactoylglutathione lyase family enzyme
MSPGGAAAVPRADSTPEPWDPASELSGGVHHVAVQTSDPTGSVAWYQAYFGCRVNWNLHSFSPLSRRRLPDMTAVTELSVGAVRFHLMDHQAGEQGPPHVSVDQFQHLCLAASSPRTLRRWRDRWFDLYQSGRFTFAHDEVATEIDTDASGMQSFYFRDVNGLEYEFSYFPDGADEPHR